METNKETGSDKMLEAVERAKKELPEAVNMAVFNNGAAAIYATPEAFELITKLLREGE